MPDQVNTGSGSHVGGDVSTGGGDFVGRDKITIQIVYPPGPFTIEQPDLAQLRADYLKYILDTCAFLDFKGTGLIEAIEKASGLSLESVYVPLRARPDLPEGETWLRIAGRMWKDDEAAAEVDLSRVARSGEPIPVDETVNRVPALVLLGDPGSGKSTLLKMLALALARMPEGPLPILVPLNAYAEALKTETISLHDFLPRYFAARQGHLRSLAPLFELALAKGQAVVLLDGLDEVQARREYVVRLVEDFAREHVPAPPPSRDEAPVPGNRFIVTSRFVGYRESPLTDPRWRRHALVDWERDEIARFVERWTRAVELAVAGGVPSEQVERDARTERDELLDAIFSHEGIERLAGNPLLLTILALIKRQGVTLPHRRVELYELYLRTLIHSWNKARSLDQRLVGPEIDYIEAVLVLAPLALWLREENPQAGLITLEQLLGFLTAHYENEGLSKADSRTAAREFLDAVHNYTNLLLERGKGQYGFIHLTFEEYLAGKGLTLLESDQALRKILLHMSDPAWHETILLAVGALGIVSQQPARAGALLEGLLAAEVPRDHLGASIVLAGEALLDVGRAGVGARAASAVTQKLIQTMHSGEVIFPHRRNAGLILGRLGWLPEDLDDWVEIPPGKFLYGDDRQTRDIERGYWIGKYPVTNLQYARFVEAGGYDDEQWWSKEGWAWRNGAQASPEAYDWLEDQDLRKLIIDWINGRSVEERGRPYWREHAELGNPVCPVVGVTWHEAQAYCNWLSAELRTSGRFGGDYVARLPDEIEWERAARGVDGREYPWEDEFDFFRANVAKEIGQGIGTSNVATFPQGRSPQGLWDCAGNVWEWTGSWYDEAKQIRVLRGGSWGNSQRDARCASRGGVGPVGFDGSIGFRVVVSLASSEF
jgi:formylglycine-generating enzyme required for sulfatase activity/energy-coupling factor transporter ATP-binding protein EcfA2